MKTGETDTDIEKWRQFLKSFDIGFREDSFEYPAYGLVQRLTLSEGMRNVTGYGCFFTQIEFDAEDGEFIEIGAWE